MSLPVDDPLTRAMAALEQLQGTGLDPVGEAAWQTAQEALLEAQEERGALLGVIREAARLLTILDSYEAALGEDDQEQIARLAQAGAEAEEALSEALSHVPSSREMNAAPLGEAALLGALDQLSEGARTTPEDVIEP